MFVQKVLWNRDPYLELGPSNPTKEVVMAIRFKHLALFATLIGTAAVTAQAQDGPTNLPAPEGIERGKQPTGGKSFLERKFNLSASEAQSRLDRQAEAEALSVQLSEAYSDAFLGL